MMSNITVYNVIELGVNNLLADYDNWNVEEVLDKETQHFPNTLHWQYGHVLTIFEQALSLGNQHVVDVEKYNKLFGYGSNPRDWGTRCTCYQRNQTTHSNITRTC